MSKKSLLRIAVAVVALAVPTLAYGVSYHVNCTRYEDSRPSVVGGDNVCAYTGPKCYECVETNTYITGIGGTRFLANIDVWGQLNALPTGYSY